MPDWISNQAKALVSAIVAFAATYLAKKFGLDIPPELQATVVAFVLGLVVYLVPNSKTNTIINAASMPETTVKSLAGDKVSIVVEDPKLAAAAKEASEKSGM